MATFTTSLLIDGDRVAATDGTRTLSDPEKLFNEEWKNDLPRRATPTSGPANEYEITHTGPYNYEMSGGGKEIWADGFDPTSGSILEAKHTSNPARSPYVDGSGIPEPIRAKIVDKTTREIARYGAVIKDPGNPTSTLTIISNDPSAVPFLNRLLEEQDVTGAWS